MSDYHDQDITIGQQLQAAQDEIERLRAELAEEILLSGAAQSDATRLSSELEKAKLDLKCLEESTVDAKAYEQCCKQRDQALAEVERLRAELEKARNTAQNIIAERPGPTQWAYKRTCEALKKRTAERDAAVTRAEAAIARIDEEGQRGMTTLKGWADACMDAREILRGNLTPSQWVRVDERLPTEEDADELGRVYTWSGGSKDACQRFPPHGILVQKWEHYHSHGAHAKHWYMWHPKPKSAPPAPPEIDDHYVEPPPIPVAAHARIKIRDVRKIEPPEVKSALDELTAQAQEHDMGYGEKED